MRRVRRQRSATTVSSRSVHNTMRLISAVAMIGPPLACDSLGSPGASLLHLGGVQLPSLVSKHPAGAENAGQISARTKFDTWSGHECGVEWHPARRGSDRVRFARLESDVLFSASSPARTRSGPAALVSGVRAAGFRPTRVRRLLGGDLPRVRDTAGK